MVGCEDELAKVRHAQRQRREAVVLRRTVEFARVRLRELVRQAIGLAKQYLAGDALARFPPRERIWIMRHLREAVIVAHTVMQHDGSGELTEQGGDWALKHALKAKGVPGLR